MERVAITDLEPDERRPEIDRRSLTGPLSAANVSINRYVLPPGEPFAASIHAHADQEEIFLVLEGEVTFETRDGVETVGADEGIRFAPGEFQRGTNETNEPVVAFGIGAPRDSEDVRISQAPELGDVRCPDCGNDALRIADGDADLVCPACGTDVTVD